MYARSHIDYVSGVRKYIYLDGNNKKYIKDKNKYYPIKKYRGVYSQKNIRGGANKTIDNVELRIYDIPGKTEEDTTPYIEFVINIDVSDYIDGVGDNDDNTYKSILNDDKHIYVFNKSSKYIAKVYEKLKTLPGMNHFVIVKTDKSFKVYINKNNSIPTDVDITRFSNFYNIIYKRNNKITKYSDDELEYFLTIFSITEDDTGDAGDAIETGYDEIDGTDEEYNTLYKSALDKLNELYLL